MASLLDTLLPATPPEPANARRVSFPGGDQGGRYHEPYEVSAAKKSAYAIEYGRKRRREGRGTSGRSGR